MLSFRQQYDISNGIFITYDRQLDKRLYHSNHKEGTRDKLKSLFPHHQYETTTKENFITTCIYVIFHNTPSSYRGLVTELREVNQKDVIEFKNRILNYNDYLGKDIKFLRDNYGGNLGYQQVFREFLDKKIQFYTVWFYIMFHPEINRDEIRKSRTLSHVLRKLEFIMLFLTFKDESVKRVENLFKELEI